jgi:N-acetylated-alpha-linked acidic dipeptidase
VNGANDPISGQAALLEEAKSIGALVKNGWRPKRTLVYCSWDGEEPGLLGSTEWAEDHGDELQKKAVIYINTDASARGFLDAGGSHALEPLVDEVAKDVTDPQTKVSIYERRKANDVVTATTVKTKRDALDQNTLKLDALGSGSDFSSFLQHLAVPALNLGFGGEDNGGEYHSIYDSYDNYVRFKDPGFYYGLALAQTAGRTALRMANADVLPFDFRHLYTTVNDYTKELMDLLQQTKEITEIENRLVKNNAYKLAADPTKTFIIPTTKEEVPFLDFSPLQNALTSLRYSSDSLSKASTKNLMTNSEHDALNKLLYRAEQQLLTKNGLPRRSWYKHSLYAPGFYTGYGVKTMPGIREAIEQHNWKEAQEQINIDADALNRLSKYLMAATR